MNTTTHTPTPWAAVADRIEQIESGACIARAATCYGAGAVEREKANAAHIVRCVNAHDELVAALTNVFMTLGKMGWNHTLHPMDPTGVTVNHSEIRQMWLDARAALAKVGGANDKVQG